MSTTNKTIKVENLDDLVRQLRELFAGDNIDVDYLQELMAAYESNPTDWENYAHFDPYRYKSRFLILSKIQTKTLLLF